ncbi:MAG: glycosyl hydrolase family 95 catalytic domain-containing protein, partial [Planctomycetota bacterium]
LGDGTHRLFVSIADRFPEGSSVDEAVAAVERAAGADFDEFVRSHRAWWEAYYPASFLSIPHSRMESFYWIQIYKLGSAIRKGGPMYDLMGPWYKDTRWPAIWWNLNTQMLYSPFPAANRLDMAENLSDMLLKHRASLIASVPEEWQHDSAGISRCTGTDLLERYDRWKEKANLVWVCHNLWVQYRCSMDEDFLRDELYPLLRRAVNTYLHQLEKDDKGVYHIPEGHSPEAFSGTDTNYDLASLRWGCKTLLRITKLLGVEDEKAERWADVLDHLAPYPQDETGFMGGPGHPAPRGHRHWSHLIMIYPYYETNWDQPEHRDVIRRSCKYWSDPKVRNTWSQAVMSSMQSSMGNGDGALLHMERALATRHLAPNTMHYEGRYFPCSETHGGMCQMVHDMLIQSWGDRIRVFPGVPGSWKDAVFHNLRAEGAFLVSAVRREGRTAWVRLQSLAGEPCVVQADFGGETPKVLAKRGVGLGRVSPGVWSLDLKKGESVVLHTGKEMPELEIAPLPMPEKEMNRYGLKVGAAPTEQRRRKRRK